MATFCIDWAEEIEALAEEKLREFGGKSGDPEDAYPNALRRSIELYGNMPDQAGAQYYEFQEALPNLLPSAEADAVMAWSILVRTRDALRAIMRDDAVAEEMYRNLPTNQDVDLSAAQDGEPSREQRDQDIGRSAASGQRASDDQIADTAFGRNTRSIDDEVRLSAWAGDRRARRFTVQLAPEVARAYKAPPCVIREGTLIGTDPVRCFRISTAYLLQSIVGIASGTINGGRGAVFPRLEPVIGRGIGKTDIIHIIGEILTRMRYLRPAGASDIDQVR